MTRKPSRFVRLSRICGAHRWRTFFAWLLAREIGGGRLVALLAAAFALITPALMFRVQMHLALSGHWTVLSALWLCQISSSSLIARSFWRGLF